MTKKEKFMKTLKTASKYTTNILAIINALLIGLDPIWNIPYCDKITATISVVVGVIGGYLLGDKALTVKKSK
jgi:hypothetical protein